MRIIRYARAPPTTSCRGLHMRLAKLNFVKILPQYKGQATGENFILQIFCRIRYTLSVHSTCGKLIESTFPYCVLFLTQNLAINILSAPYEPNHSAKTC